MPRVYTSIIKNENISSNYDIFSLCLKQKNSYRGFTIVELLIVIVVIAILAAISIVAYNGFQARAENTKTIKALSDYVRIMKAFAANSNDNIYPVAAGYPCLGEASETCGSMPAFSCFGLSNPSGSAALVNSIKTVVNNVPQMSSQSLSCNSTRGVAKGAFYYSADGKTALIGYILRGNLQCDQSGQWD